jgi:hypothetical protein
VFRKEWGFDSLHGHHCQKFFSIAPFAVQWRKLGAQIERLQWDKAPEPASSGGRPTLH